MDALTALWQGAFGSPYAFFSATLVRATPLVLLGLAVATAFRAGVLNIGAEGQLLVGASAAVAVALAAAPLGSAWLVLPLALAAGALAGGAWAAVAGELRRRFGVLEVISTIMLNFVAQYLVSWLVRGPMQEPTGIYPQSVTISPLARLPLLVPGQRLHLGFALGVALAGLLWWWLARTAAGFRVRAVGAGADAARSTGGVDAERVMLGVFVASGALAGLAGAIEATGVTYALYEGISPGFGYTAIAVALLARLDPRWVVASAVLFGALEAGAAAMQRDAGVPSTVAAVIEALVVLVVLGAERWQARAAARRVVTT